jgi:hypothetical protein
MPQPTILPSDVRHAPQGADAPVNRPVRQSPSSLVRDKFANKVGQDLGCPVGWKVGSPPELTRFSQTVAQLC